MATVIPLVGVAYAAGTAAASRVLSLTSLTGGSGSAPLEGDVCKG